MTQLERVIEWIWQANKIRHSTKGGTQIEPREWH